MSVALLLGATGCNMNNTGKGAAIGAGGGAAVGAGLGAIFGGGKGAAIGAAIGTAVGAGTGAIIGRKMDKQKEQLAQIEGAQVETVTDQNNLQAIKSLSMQESFSAPERATSAKLRKMLSASLQHRSSKTHSPTSPSMATPTTPAPVP